MHSQGDSWFPGVPGVAGKLPGGSVCPTVQDWDPLWKPPGFLPTPPGGLESSIVRWTAGHLRHFILFSHPSLKTPPYTRFPCSRGTSFTPAPGDGQGGRAVSNPHCISWQASGSGMSTELNLGLGLSHVGSRLFGSFQLVLNLRRCRAEATAGTKPHMDPANQVGLVGSTQYHSHSI